MIVNQSTDRMNEVYEKYKQYFLSNFHSVLWHLYVDNTFAGKVTCFVQNFKNGGIMLGIATANESGYTPTPAYFADGTKHDQAQDVLDQLNKDVFGLEEDTAFEIMASSMRRVDAGTTTIQEAEAELLRAYAEYVEGKIDVDEIPLDFEQWQDFNNSIGDTNPQK